MTSNAVIDLFCGAGGFALSAHFAGFNPILAVDVDSDLTSSFNRNFPGIRLLLCDLATLDPQNALQIVGLKPGELSGILGGPPCQGFSTIGKKDPEDARNTLIWHFFRFVEGALPKFFVLENVPGILKCSFLNAGLDRVRPYYQFVGPVNLDAADYGAATHRKRVFVIGYRKEYVDPLSVPDLQAAKRPPATVRQALHDLPPLSSASVFEDGHHWARYPQEPDAGDAGKYARKARKAPAFGLADRTLRGMFSRGLVSGFATTRHTREILERFAGIAPSESDRISKCVRLKWEDRAPVLRAGTGKDKGSYQSIRPIHPEENRVICVREAARLQGFPDWFLFHPTKWHSFRMIGNSISPVVGEAILRAIGVRLGVERPVDKTDQACNSANTG